MEQRYLTWLGLEYWTGEGHVIEVGPWLGGSTVCLARGMEANAADSTARLHVFDNFIWRDFMTSRAELPLTTGDSFFDFFLTNTASHASVITPHVAQLPDDHPAEDAYAIDARGVGDPRSIDLFQWPNAPAEILFVDGAKSWTGMRHLLREVAASLIPGKGLIVCQDYAYWGAYWVAMALAMLPGRVVPVHRVPPGTVSFRVSGAISQRQVDEIPAFEELSVEDGLHLLRSAAMVASRLRWRSVHWSLRAAQVRFLLHKGEPERAREELQTLLRSWPPLVSVSEIEGARIWFSASTGAEIDPISMRRLRVGLSKVTARRR